FTGGPDALGFMDVLPADRVAPLRVAVTAPAAGSARAAAAAEAESGLDAALVAALARDGRAACADIAAASSYSETTVRRRLDQLRATGALYFDLELDMPSFGFRCSAW